MQVASKSVGHAYEKRPARADRLFEVSEEADKIWSRHRAGEISSDEAARLLSDLHQRYAGLLDRILAL